MKAWAIFTTIAITLLWLVSLTRKDTDSEGQPNNNNAPPQVVVQPPREPIHINPLEDPDKVNVAELLTRPRAELAAKCQEKEQQILDKEKMRIDGRLTFATPNRYPLANPIWRQAKYSESRDMVLPPYLAVDAYDSTLALHLARFGDAEAARKIADPSDDATMDEINRLALSRNYPAEWTRLVALYQHEAHVMLAQANNDGARRVVAFHRQLQALFGDDARKSPLGNALLTRGRFLLEDAKGTWVRSEVGVQEGYQELVENALSEWGDAAGATLPPPRTAEQMEKWLGAKTQGLLVSGGNPQRALDVLGLPLPAEALQGVVALFNQAGTLQEVVVVYGPDQVEVHIPRHVSHWLEEQLAAGTQPAADYRMDIKLTVPSVNIGALVRIIPQQAAEQKATAKTTPTLPREFGLLSLDRTFEQSRRLYASNQNGSRLTISDAKHLAGLKPPFAGQTFSRAMLTRDGKNNLVGDLQLALVLDAENVTLIDLAGPIWQQLGAGDVDVTGSTSRDCVDLTWKDASTRLCLRVPNQDQSVTLEVRDGSGKEAGKRLESAQVRDTAERAERWKSNKKLKLLNRSFEQFELGVGRAELARRMTRGQTLRHEFPGGDLYTLPDLRDDDPNDWVLRQAVARFDESGKLVEARLRYCDRPNKKAGTTLTALLETIKSLCGAPEIVDDSSAKVWRWLDDTTLWQTRADGEGVELILKDCPLDHGQGRPLPALAWLPRGPARCALGTTREALYKQWRVKTPVMVGDAVFLRPEESSPFDGILVWFDGDEVNRVVARNRRGADPLPNPAAAGKAVSETWGRQAQMFGWPLQIQVSPRQGHILSWGNADECTQVRIFWQETENSLRVFTEWK